MFVLIVLFVVLQGDVHLGADMEGALEDELAVSPLVVAVVELAADD